MHLRVAVNLSARLLQDTAFPGRLGALLQASGVAAASLEIEITESAMMLDPARALRVLQEIHTLGVVISIDDFGTGYSSLGYLRDLPVSALKLDKSFVMGMRNNSDDRIIVESTAKMAHALKLELVAEGVESDWDARFLKAAGYDFAQGFLYSRALPADRFLPWSLEYTPPHAHLRRHHNRSGGAGDGVSRLTMTAGPVAARALTTRQTRQPSPAPLERFGGRWVLSF